MKKPIHITIPDAYHSGLTCKNRCPASAEYRIAYAACNHWQHPEFSIIEQYYDAKDAFICLLEIKTPSAISLPISCTLHDLYWIYQLNGDLKISEHADQGQHLLALPIDRYRIAYLPPKTLSLDVPKGNHLLFYFVVKSAWLLRRPCTRMEELQSFLAKLRAKLMVSDSTKLFPISVKSRMHLLSLFGQPKRLPVEQDCVVYDKVIHLLVNSLSAIEGTKKPLMLKSIQLLDAMHELIGERLGNAQHILIKELANHFGVSTSYLNMIHRQRYQVSLKRYLAEQKFNYARMLLQQEQLDIGTVSHRLGYNQPAAFTKQFTLYFGFPPSSFQTPD